MITEQRIAMINQAHILYRGVPHDFAMRSLAESIPKPKSKLQRLFDLLFKTPGEELER